MADLVDTEFTPAEAAVITGVNVTLQRKWRKHVPLDRAGGWTRWSGDDLAQLMLLGLLAKLGGPALAIGMLQPTHERSEDSWMAAMYVWGHALLATGSEVAGFVKSEGELELPHYLVSHSERGFGPLERLEDLPPLSGPAVLLDIKHLGQEMAARAPRPLAKVV